MVFTVIDIETTGLSKNRHAITEIAAARVVKGKITRRFQTLVNPQVRIPSFITRLTGIDNELVEDAPLIKEVLPSFMKFIKNDVFVAHNATFDYGFIDRNLQIYHNYELNNKKLCTRKLANRIFPDLHSKRLGVLCEHLDIVNSNAHRAMSDVEATVEVFNHMLKRMENKNIVTTKDILKFEKLPIRRI